MTGVRSRVHDDGCTMTGVRRGVRRRAYDDDNGCTMTGVRGRVCDDGCTMTGARQRVWARRRSMIMACRRAVAAQRRGRPFWLDCANMPYCRILHFNFRHTYGALALGGSQKCRTVESWTSIFDTPTRLWLFRRSKVMEGCICPPLFGHQSLRRAIRLHF